MFFKVLLVGFSLFKPGAARAPFTIYKYLIALFINLYNIFKSTAYFFILVFALFYFSIYLISRANNIIFLLNIYLFSSQVDTCKIILLLIIINKAKLLAKSATLSSYIAILAAIKL